MIAYDDMDSLTKEEQLGVIAFDGGNIGTKQHGLQKLVNLSAFMIGICLRNCTTLVYLCATLTYHCTTLAYLSATLAYICTSLAYLCPAWLILALP